MIYKKCKLIASVMLKAGKCTITVYIFFKHNEYYKFIC